MMKNHAHRELVVCCKGENSILEQSCCAQLLRRMRFLVLCVTFLLVTADDEESSLEKVKAEVDDIENNILPKIEDLAMETAEESNDVSVQKEGKMAKVRQKLVETKSKIVNLDEDKADRISGAVTAVGGGAFAVIDAIKAGDVKAFIVGALDLVAGLAALGGPAGQILSSVLGMLSGFMSLFSSQEAVESKEAMMKRVVETALEDSIVEQFTFEVSGTKDLYSQFLAAVRQLRKSTTVSAEEASELYNLAFMNLEVIGKLKENIKKNCGSANTVGKTKKQIEAVVTIVDRCLTFSTTYAELVISRHFLLADMASIMSQHANLKTTQSNLLALIRKEQKSDAIFFRFFYDPFNRATYRRAVAQFWDKEYKYPVLSAYLDKLGKFVGARPKETYVMVCSAPLLNGACNQFSEGRKSGNDMEGWDDKIMSVYIPAGKSMYGFVIQHITGPRRFDQHGRFSGPMVLGVIPGSYAKIKENLAEFDSWTIKRWYQYIDFLTAVESIHFELFIRQWLAKELKRFKSDWDEITVLNEGDDSEAVVFCLAENLNPKEFCLKIRVPKNEHVVNVALDHTHGVDIRYLIQSMRIPAGLSVTAQGGSTTYGPFYGSDIYPRVCGSKSWRSLVINRVLPSQNAQHKVKVCSKVNFGGQCDRFSISSSMQMMQRGCDWKTETGTNATRINSIEVPGKVTVLFETINGMNIGPLHGPSKFPYIDGKGVAGFMMEKLTIKSTIGFVSPLKNIPINLSAFGGRNVIMSSSIDRTGDDAKIIEGFRPLGTEHDGIMANGGCASTRKQPAGEKAIWNLELRSRHAIEKIVVWRRVDSPNDDLDGFEFRLDGLLCDGNGEKTTKTDRTYTKICDGMSGTDLYIISKNTPMVLCGVDIWGYSN